jgi:hypothetical protein
MGSPRKASAVIATSASEKGLARFMLGAALKWREAGGDRTQPASHAGARLRGVELVGRDAA